MNYELIIPVLAGLSVVTVGGAILLARAARRAPVRARLGDVGAPGGGGASAFRPAGGPTTDSGSKYSGVGGGGAAMVGAGVDDMLGEIGRRMSPSASKSSNLAQELVQAGYHDRRAAAVFMGAKVVLLLLGAVSMSLLLLPLHFSVPLKLMWGLCATGFLFFIPNLVLANRRSKRRAEVRRHLPDAIDLLEICASAGMGLDMAWNSVADEVRSVSSTLADEMALTNLEIHLGAARAVAMRNMAGRTGADELSSLVAVLVQSERFGTSVVEALRTYANSMRESRSMRSQEAAEKMAVKLLFPMILFIFPSVVIVMVGPAAMTLYKIFSS